jgi:uncharacterized protein DUF5666
MRYSIALLACAALAACSGDAPKSSSADTTAAAPSASSAQSAANDTMATLRGVIASISATDLVVKTDSSSVTVKIVPPLKVYARVPSDLANVKESTFIGVTTVKQPDGSEQATEIHIFPEDLRGLGEGSRMMTPPAGANANAAASRMTNGSASPSPAATPSRMSNGNVASTNGSTFVVQYAGGSQTVIVPPKTPVSEIKAASRSLAVGDQAIVLAKRAADGSLLASSVLLAK